MNRSIVFPVIVESSMTFFAFLLLVNILENMATRRLKKKHGISS
jgi:hypothetical protein